MQRMFSGFFPSLSLVKQVFAEGTGLWSRTRSTLKFLESLLAQGVVHIRYGLVVRIAGSHPAGPGSIPCNGRRFAVCSAKQLPPN